jgi:ABC-type Fe3+-hydroxamate transport system substrate-binding protein
MYHIIHQHHFEAPIGFKGNAIVCLVPSITQLLHYLGVDDEVVGITQFCVLPNEWAVLKNIIGGTKNVDVEKVKKLQPNLIIANKEENVKIQIEALATSCTVYVSDVHNLATSLQMITQIGQLVGKQAPAATLVQRITISFSQLNITNYIPTAYLIWRKPYMTVGGDTFISHIMQLGGFNNVFADEIRYPEITTEWLQLLNCKLILLSSEPYPFVQKHVDELQRQLPNTKILLVNGQFFSWYGSLLLYTANYLKSVQHMALSTV